MDDGHAKTQKCCPSVTKRTAAGELNSCASHSVNSTHHLSCNLSTWVSLTLLSHSPLNSARSSQKMAAFRSSYFIFLSVARLSWSLDISGSYASMTRVPLWSKNLAMDLVNSASRCCFVLPLMKVSFRVYLSSNLGKDDKPKTKHRHSASNNRAPRVFEE